MWRVTDPVRTTKTSLSFTAMERCTFIHVCVCVSRTPVTWRLNNSSALPWHQVTSDGSLVLTRVEPSAQGDYSCWDGRGTLLHTVRLRLGRECPQLLPLL